MLNKRLSIFLMIVVTLFASCTSSRRGRMSREKKDSLPTLSYQTLGAKTAVTMGGFSLGASLRMKKDSCIYLSVQPFAGVEVARLFVTNKEMTLVDRINKRYTTVDLQAEKDSVEYANLLSVSKLQAILTDQLFLLNEKDDMARISDFSSSKVENAWLLQYANPKNLFSQEFVLDENQRVKSGMAMSDQGSVKWNYADFQPLENGYQFPREFSLTVYQLVSAAGYHTPGSSKVEMSMEISYKKIELNKDYSFSNPIPKGYEKVSIQEILSLLNLKR